MGLGPWCWLGARIQKGDWASCGWDLGLGLDYGVNDLLGHPVDGWVGPSWDDRRRLLQHYGFRPGKLLIDAIILLSQSESNIHLSSFDQSGS